MKSPRTLTTRVKTALYRQRKQLARERTIKKRLTVLEHDVKTLERVQRLQDALARIKSA